jgi:hypothetical protein
MQVSTAITVLVFLALAIVGVIFFARREKTLAIQFVAVLPVTFFISVATLILYFWPYIQEGTFLKNAEKDAKRMVTGDELQSWALKLLADPQNQLLKTSYPVQLRDLYPSHFPHVEIVTNSIQRTNFVYLSWGGVDWQLGFKIGPTNFVSSGHKWQDGIYFVAPH